MIKLLLSLLLVLSVSSLSRGQQSEPKVLYIGVDGVRPDALKKATTPNFDRLIREGVYFADTQILGERYQKNDTISGPGWSSILTGVWADKHGVHDNSFKGKNYQQYPHFFVRLKEAKPKATTASFVDWNPIDKYIVDGADFHKSYPASGAEAYARADKLILEDATKHISETVPDATFVYFGQIDETGHKHGFHPTVGPYIDAIERVDSYVGRLLEVIDENRKGNDWLVLVTTDHGGEGRGHGGGHNNANIRNIFAILSGNKAVGIDATQRAYLVDVPVTALAHLGVEPLPEWKLDGRSLLSE